MGRNPMPITKPVVKDESGNFVADSFSTIVEAIEWKNNNCPKGYVTLVAPNNK